MIASSEIAFIGHDIFTFILTKDVSFNKTFLLQKKIEIIIYGKKKAKMIKGT